VPRDNEIGAHQPASRCDEASQDGGGDGEWWVCDHPERPLWQSEVDCVGHDHGDGATDEGSSQGGCPLSVELNGNNPGAACEERPCERPVAGADIEYEITRANSGVRNDLYRPTTTELVPPPTCPFRGHVAPS
jgi:hypothetical protein